MGAALAGGSRQEEVRTMAHDALDAWLDRVEAYELVYARYSPAVYSRCRVAERRRHSLHPQDGLAE